MTSAAKIFSASLLACLAGLATAPAQAQERVLAIAPLSTALSERQASVVELGKASSAATGVSIATARIASLASPAGPPRITLALAGDTEITASRVGGHGGPEG